MYIKIGNDYINLNQVNRISIYNTDDEEICIAISYCNGEKSQTYSKDLTEQSIKKEIDLGLWGMQKCKGCEDK